MAFPIPATKLYIPYPRPNLVPRPHLIERLNEGLQRSLILVSAPAGFGKTTIISHWLQQVEMPVAWLSLDPADNELNLALSVILVCLQQIDRKIGASYQEMLRSAEPLPLNFILTMLVNNIAAVSKDFIFVLDDYQMLAPKNIDPFMTFVLNHFPPNLHLVIITRTDPQFNLARLRGQDQIIELRADDLRFTDGETEDFLNGIMKLGLSSANIASLKHRTEGWIVGLQLAALSMQNRDDRTDFIDKFSGSQRYVLDYLTHEVLEHQPDTIKHFLLATSVLDRMCAPLCDAVVEGNNSQSILEALDSANLFIVPLDDTRCWYRYHRLFAEFLRNQLYQSDPEIVRQYQSRAARWLEDNGFIQEAVDYALASLDYEWSIEMIERIAPKFPELNLAMERTLEWLDSLPEESLQQYPRICLYYACILMVKGRLDEVEFWLKNIERLETKPNPSNSDLSGNVISVRAMIAYQNAELSRTIEYSRQSLKQLSKNDMPWRVLIKFLMGTASVAIGETPRADQVFQEILEIGHVIDSPNIIIAALSCMAQLKILQGRLFDAADLFQQAIDVIQSSEQCNLFTSSMAYIGLGYLLREWNDLEAAETNLIKGISLVNEGISSEMIEGLIGLVDIYRVKGDEKGVSELMQDVDRFRLKQMNWSWFLGPLHACQAKLILTQGDLDGASRWARVLEQTVETENNSNTSMTFIDEKNRMTLARVLIAESKEIFNRLKLEKALHILEELVPLAEKSGRINDLIEIWILQALAWDDLSNRQEALRRLTNALSIAEPGGYIRIFVSEGAPMEMLLKQAQSAEIAVPYTTRLLAAFSEERRNRPASSYALQISIQGPKFPASLSEREVEVIRLVAEGLSNHEIAERLFITLGTVKSHLTSIFHKLDVHSRTQTIVKARELELL